LSEDDRFRVPGSRYENEEPVAIAVVPQTAQIDWTEETRVPPSTLWLPETLYTAIAERTLLRQVELYCQSKLDRATCELLCQELTTVAAESPDSDVSLAASLVLQRARLVAEASNGERLLIEGP
jgi:hypothetical protein